MKSVVSEKCCTFSSTVYLRPAQNSVPPLGGPENVALKHARQKVT